MYADYENMNSLQAVDQLLGTIRRLVQCWEQGKLTTERGMDL